MSIKQSYRKLSSDEIKEKELNILLYFQSFCKQHDLSFYLSGGTLLGSVRHKGFIPWDDDIDVCMPRDDYEKLIDIYKNEEHQYQLRTQKKQNFIAPYTKLVDIDTLVESVYTKSDENSHIWIDIFPVDGLPESVKETTKLYKKCAIYRRLFLLADARIGEGKSVFAKLLKPLIKPLVNFYGKKRLATKINSVAQTYGYNDMDYVGAITWGLYGVGEKMLKVEFEQAIETEFEGYTFPAFSCWHSYLTGLYGDYMQLPPEDKRQTHDMIVYVKE